MRQSVEPQHFLESKLSLELSLEPPKAKNQQPRGNLCTRHTTGHATSWLPLLLPEITFAGKSVIKVQTHTVQCLSVHFYRLKTDLGRGVKTFAKNK